MPDLRGAILPGGDTTGHHTNGETDFNTNGDGHGTMMSVLIAGQGYGTGMVGVAPKAKILPVVINAGATDVTADPGATAAGIIYAANHRGAGHRHLAGISVRLRVGVRRGRADGGGLRTGPGYRRRRGRG